MSIFKKKSLPVIEGPHACVYDIPVENSETELKPPRFKEGKWQAFTSKAFLCKCGSQNNLTMTYEFMVQKK